jgi:hypothetical protein
MNKELLSKLRKQSKVDPKEIVKALANTTDGAVVEHWLEQFAKSIVRECAKTVNDTEYPYEDESHKNTWDACCVWSADKLKEHFGIEHEQV